MRVDIPATIKQIRETGDGWDVLREGVIKLVATKLDYVDGLADADVQDITQNCLIRILKALDKIDLDQPRRGANYVLLMISSECANYGRSLSVRDRCIKPPSDVRWFYLTRRMSGFVSTSTDYDFVADDFIHLAGDRKVDQELFRAWLYNIPFTHYAKSAGYSHKYIWTRWTAVRKNLRRLPNSVKDSLLDLKVTHEHI